MTPVKNNPVKYNPGCLRKVANWSKMKAAHKFDKAKFDPETVRTDIPKYSPKMAEILKNMKDLDEKDLAETGTTYKHFIFSDVKQGGFGAKVIASSLIASGMTLGYTKNIKVKSDSELLDNKGKNFFLLCSTAVFDKPITSVAKKEILSTYNKRPDNIYGDLARIIVMDSGFKEGIDLFDVKYVHIFEPQTSKADQKQVIGRGTRTCGQKGLDFHPTQGWPLHVFVYDVGIPKEMGADTLFKLYVINNGIDLRKLQLADELEKYSIIGSVDYELNKNIHRFEIEDDSIAKIDLFAAEGGAPKPPGKPTKVSTKPTEVQCDKNCGKGRPTRDVPVSKAMFITVFLAQKRTFPDDIKTMHLREFFCQLLKSDKTFCAKIKEIFADRVSFVKMHAKEIMKAIKLKKHYPLLPSAKASFLKFIFGILPRPDKKALGEFMDKETQKLIDAAPKPKVETPTSTPSPSPSLTPEEKQKKVKDLDPTVPSKHMSFLAMRQHVRENFSQFAWPKVQLENMCGPAPPRKSISNSVAPPIVYANVNGNARGNTQTPPMNTEMFTNVAPQQNNAVVNSPVNVGQASMNVGQASMNVRENSPVNVGQTSMNVGQTSMNVGQASMNVRVNSPVNVGQASMNVGPQNSMNGRVNSPINVGPQNSRNGRVNSPVNVGLQNSRNGRVNSPVNVFTPTPNNATVSPDNVNVVVNANTPNADDFGPMRLPEEPKANSSLINSFSTTLEKGVTSLKEGVTTLKEGVEKVRTAIRGSPDKVGNSDDVASPSDITLDLKGGAEIMSFTPTQDFLRNFYTPATDSKGMLFWHSVGSGKTCSAIATASSSFEKEGYTILWVTRTTLKSDIWKNMFDQVCSMDIKAKIEKGIDIPPKLNDRMKLLSSNWSIRPMSYKQFSNLVSGNNSLYKSLVKKNGPKDPLRKTLLIIDEAHKLYGGTDLSSIERPNMNKLHAAIMKSYKVSGKHSVRLMLMTATPFTNDPMELVKLLNLCRPEDEQMPVEYSPFAKKYLTPFGTFSKKGKRRFLDDIAGQISYLNRERDARQFAQPRITPVIVPMSTSDGVDVQSVKNDIKDAVQLVQANMNDLKEAIKTEKKALTQRKKDIKAECKGLKKQELAECKDRVLQEIQKIDDDFIDFKASKEKEMVSTKKDITNIRKEMKSKLEEAKNDSSQLNTIQKNCVSKAKPKKPKTEKKTKAKPTPDEFNSDDESLA